MGYLNRFALIEAILSGVPPDRVQLFSTVNRQQIFNRINKYKPELREIGKFNITDNPVEEENWSKMSGKDKKKILKLNTKVRKSINLDKVIKELTNYRVKYPNVPTIYPGRAVRYLPAPPQSRTSGFSASGSSIISFANLRHRSA